MKHLKLFFALFAMLALGVGNAWGEEKSITLTYNTFGLTTSYSQKTATVDGIGFTVNQGYKGSGNVIQMNSSKGDGILFNTTSITGLKSITINVSSGSKTYTISSGTSQNPTGNSQTGTSTKTFSIPSGDTYFQLKVSGASYFTSIVITYDEVSSEGGGDTPVPGAGSEGTLVITRSCFPSGTLAYNTTDIWSATASTGETVSGQGDLYSTANQTTMQTKNSSVSTHYHNTTAMPGAIKKISMEMASGTNRSYTVYASTSQISSTTGLTSVGTVKSGTPIEIDPVKGYKYFWLQCTGGASYLNNITIVYEASGSGSTETAVSVTPNPTSLDFGTVIQNAVVPAKTFTITGSNLTSGDLTISASDGYTATPSTIHVSEATLESQTITVQPNTPTTVGSCDGNIKISGCGLTSAVSVALSMTVEKAPATTTGTTYVKVTDAVTDGEYLIVYEEGAVAFNGSLAILDAVGNKIEVTISNNTIAGNTDIDAATFTISNIEIDTFAIKSKSNKYIGRTSSSNGMNTSDDEIKNTITITDGTTEIKGSGSGASTSLQYYSTSGSERFRYYGSTQNAIALYKKVDASEVIAPTFSPDGGEYYGTQSVEITCATTDAKIYYTLDGTNPTSASTEYTGAISISETKTLKAIAIKGENSSTIATATYTILAPLSTMDEIFDKATAVGNTATPVCIKMDNWVVTGVKNSNVYVTDGTKGFIIYNASHGFVVGDQLSGIVTCKVQLYNGSSELTNLTSTTGGLKVTDGGTITPVVVDNVTTLSGVNTGSVIKITGTCETTNTVAGVKLYSSLYAFDDLILGSSYNVTGVYLQYNATKEILPREDADIEKLDIQETATITISNITMEIGDQKTIEATITPDAAIPTVQYAITSGTCITLNGTTITAVSEGTATITATIAEVAGSYYGTTKDFTVTVNAPNIAELPFEYNSGKSDIENTAGMTHSGLGTDYNASSNPNTILKFDNTDDNVIIHFNGQADKLTYDIKGNSFSGGTFTVQESADGDTYTDVATYTELGETATQTHTLKSDSRYVKFVYTEKSSGNVGLGNITISKADLRQETGLAWNPETVSITVGDAFTAPIFSNPNSLAVTFNSDNTALATVSNTGVVSLNAGVSGKAVITASYAGDATYKTAEVTCVITVSPKSEKVVILAEYNGQWYALKAEYTTDKTDRLAAMAVNFVGGKLYNIAEKDKATIEWQLSISGTKATFKNGDNYLTGSTSTTLKLSTTTYEWDFDEGLYLSDDNTRTFIYHKDGYFRNYATTNAIPNSTTYSDKPVVTAPVYDTAIEISDGDNSTVITANAGQKVNVIVDRALEAGSEWYTLCVPFNMPASLIGKAYQISGLIQQTDGYVEVNLAEKTTIEAGQPYLIQPNVTVDKFVVENVTIVNTTGASISKSIAGLSVTMQGVINGAGTTDGLYWVGNGGFLYDDSASKLGLRTYFNITTPSGIAPRMRVVAGENVETGVEDIFSTDAPVKVIENGQLIIIRDGVKYNVQGQKL